MAGVPPAPTLPFKEMPSILCNEFSAPLSMLMVKVLVSPGPTITGASRGTSRSGLAPFKVDRGTTRITSYLKPENDSATTSEIHCDTLNRHRRNGITRYRERDRRIAVCVQIGTSALRGSGPPRGVIIQGRPGARELQRHRNIPPGEGRLPDHPDFLQSQSHRGQSLGTAPGPKSVKDWFQHQPGNQGSGGNAARCESLNRSRASIKGPLSKDLGICRGDRQNGQKTRHQNFCRFHRFNQEGIPWVSNTWSS